MDLIGKMKVIQHGEESLVQREMADLVVDLILAATKELHNDFFDSEKMVLLMGSIHRLYPTLTDRLRDELKSILKSLNHDN